MPGDEVTNRAASPLEPDAVAELRRALEALVRGEPEAVPLRHDGSARDAFAELVNELGMAFASVHDELREKTRALEERASLGAVAEQTAFATLSAGVGHELNTPLSYAAGNLEFVEEELETLQRDGELGRLIEVIDALRDTRDGVLRAASIAAELERLAPAFEPTRDEPADLQQLVEATLTMVRNAVHHRARLVCHYEPVPPVRVDRGRIGQIVVNLVQNALQALPAGRSHAENRIEVAVRPHAGMVALEVCDNGIGIPDENRVRIFDSFFTTQPVGQGTGLGLALTKRVVSDQGGRIEVESAVGVGTTMRVLLPAVPP